MPKFELHKDTAKVKFMLEKRAIPKLTAEVVALVDGSGSMQGLYQRGSVQNAIQRVVPVAVNFDDNGDIPVYVYDTNFIKADNPLTAANHADYVKKEVIPIVKWGGTKLSPVLTAAVADLGFIKTAKSSGGFFSKFTGSGSSTHTFSENSTSGMPAIIYAFTDGDNSDERETEELLIKLSKANSQVYFNFIGVGTATEFLFLQRVADDLPNVNFVQIADITKTGDGDEIYEFLLPTELTDWLRKFVK